MNRLVWLPAVVLITVLGFGCQSTKFPSPKWPDIALFKKKDKELAPPSQHFDVAEQQQLADSSAAERKPTQIPGESTAGAIKPPSDQAKPTAPMVAGKSGSATGSASGTKTSATPGSPAAESAASSQPIRKPYELAKSSADSLNQAASSIASDVERNAVAAKDQINRNANEVVGQFQQQGRDLADAAGNSINQAAASLNQSANNALNLGTPATASSSPTNSSSAGSGGAFAFSRPAATPANSGGLPPWSNPSATANSTPADPTNSPQVPSNPAVDPLKSLAASSALTPSTPSSSPGSPPPSPFAPKNTQPAERQLQPINQQLVNQNLGAPAQDSASGQFQLPVAQPPTFVANRSATPGNSAFASTIPSSSPQGTASGLKPSEPSAPVTDAGRQPAVSSNPSNYPSTGFNVFVAAGSAAPKQNAAEPNSSSSAFQPSAGKINSGWQTQANSVAPVSQPVQPSSNLPVSHTAELPAELMQRSGSYAPGSVGGDSSSQTLWR